MLTVQLRRVLLALVSLNLLFVQITASVSVQWLIPLYTLTLASPWLWNLQRFFLYRLAWNVALVGIFATLIVDVRRSGIRFLLEDGLILAAFCQVHVLNNLRKQKRPDLIFFNSFLIALVTGFFCQDLVYSVVFAAYAIFLIFALSLTSATTVVGVPSRILPAAEMRQLLRRSLKHGTVVLAITGLVFTFWPRDFEREGLVEDQLASSAAAAEVAFADQIRFDRRGKTVLTNRIEARVKLTHGNREQVPTHWRGATFSMLHHYGWTADTNPQRVTKSRLQLDEPWKRKTAHEFIRTGHRLGAAVKVELLNPRVLNLFLPLATHRVQFNCHAFPNLDGNFRISHHGSKEPIRYLAELNGPGDPPGRGPGKPAAAHTRLRARAIPKGARELNAQLRESLPKSLPRRELVERARRFLASSRTYALPGEEGAAGTLQRFLAGDGGGHCEYFATTLVVLLRLNRVPCRMVSGYLAHEWNEAGTELLIRGRDAHAWVEVWDDTDGWYTVDPTPAADSEAEAQASWLSEVGKFLKRAWTAVTGFDGSSRAAAFDWAKAQLLATLNFGLTHPLSLLGILAALLALRRWWKRRRGPAPAVQDYCKVLEKLKLDRSPEETPRQLLARAERLPLAEPELRALAEATAEHERQRYGV